ncbi:MAG: PAS domain S-box protein [Planctomycetota bacterium]|nr:PAS domain S-box protein [Planctomycetota bacterium]
MEIDGSNVSSTLFEVLCDATPDAVICADLGGNVTHWSPGAERTFGFAADEIVGSSVARIVPRERQPELENNLKRVNAGAPVDQFETVRLHKSGRPIDVVLTVRPIRSVTDEVVGSLAVIRDESQHRRTAESLQLSEQRFRNLMEGSIQGILIHRDQRPLFVNESYAAIHGYTVDELMAIESMSQLHSPADKQRIRDYMRARLNDGDAPSRYEYRGLRKDGSLVWLENAVRVVDWDGEPAIQATVFDISERKQNEFQLRALNETLERRVHERTEELAHRNADLQREIAERKKSEANLRQSQLFYSSLVENIPLCVARKDLDGRFTFANRALCELFGKSFEEIVGQDDFAFSPPEMAKKYRADDLRVAQTGRMLEVVERHPGEDGRDKYIQTIKTAIRDLDDKVIGTQLVFTDLSDRIRNEEELKETNARRQAIFDSSLDCMIFIDPTGRISQFNRSAQRTFGYKANEVIGMELDDLFHQGGSAKDRTRSNIDRYANLGESGSMLGQRSEVTLYTKDGTEFIAEMAMQPIPIRGENGFAIFLRDVTDRRKAEDRRRRAEEEVRLKNRDLETLLYVISHDLREPLRAIDNFSRIVKESYENVIDAKGSDFLTRIYRAAQRMDRLLDDVLMLSRAQRIEHSKNDVDLGDVARDVVKQLEVRIEETNARVTIAEGLPRMHVDKRWVTRAVFNLIGNALKYTVPGELVSVEVAAYDGTPDNKSRGLVVRDRGPGVPAEAAERIFVLFQRAVGREVEGTGAGLAIVRQVAERHGGFAWVEPREGGGSNFYLTFGTGAESPHALDDTDEESVSIFDD